MINPSSQIRACNPSEEYQHILGKLDEKCQNQSQEDKHSCRTRLLQQFVYEFDQ